MHNILCAYASECLLRMLDIKKILGGLTAPPKPPATLGTQYHKLIIHTPSMAESRIRPWLPRLFVDDKSRAQAVLAELLVWAELWPIS